MAHIRLGDKEIELSVGELWIRADDSAGVRFGSASPEGDLAIIAVDPRGTATVRRATSGGTVFVNGVALGAEPAPLLHGDRIEVAGRQLRFSDDRKAGSTVLMPAFGASATRAETLQRGRAAACRGRLVSLVDGRESKFPGGHLDSARIGDARPLRRGDIIRIGGEEFRFYADESAASASSPATVDVRPPSRIAPEIQAATAATNADAGVVVGLEPPHSKRAPAARPVVASRAPKRTERGPSSRGVPAAVWLAAAALIGATVLLVLQDR